MTKLTKNINNCSYFRNTSFNQCGFLIIVTTSSFSAKRVLDHISRVLGPVHTELLAIALAMQKWVENFAKEWVEYPFLDGR